MIGVERRRHPRRKRVSVGFTLMELLVVLGIFSTVVTAASDILMMSNRSQRKVFTLEKTQSDARYTMETMAREIRTGTVDYAWYEANSPLLNSGAAGQLALVAANGDKMRFYVEHDEAACGAADNTPCVMVSINDTTVAPMTAKGVQVRFAHFYISPKADPFKLNTSTGLFNADAQPLVTVVLILESSGTSALERSLVHFQTTVGSRAYKR